MLCAGMVLPGAVGETQETQPRLRRDGRGRSPDRAAEVQGMVLFRQVSCSPISTNLRISSESKRKAIRLQIIAQKCLLSYLCADLHVRILNFIHRGICLSAFCLVFVSDRFVKIVKCRSTRLLKLRNSYNDIVFFCLKKTAFLPGD